MEYLLYDPGKANVIANELSQKDRVQKARVAMMEWEMTNTLNEFNLQHSTMEDKCNYMP